MKIYRILEFLDKKIPFKSALIKDNVGEQILFPDNHAENIVLSLDITSEVIEFAKKKKSNLIITHHPLLYKIDINNLNYSKIPDKLIMGLIKNSISVISLHTNFDASISGINYYVARKLNLKNLTGIEKTIENYYIGVIGCLSKKTSLKDLSSKIKKIFNLKELSVINPVEKIKKLAICSGRGTSLLNLLANKNIDAYITGDIDYHSILFAKESNICLIDVSHYDSEILFVDLFYNIIKNDLKNIKIFKYKKQYYQKKKI